MPVKFPKTAFERQVLMSMLLCGDLDCVVAQGRMEPMELFYIADFKGSNSEFFPARNK
jgi:hypothetical protein